MPHHSEPQAHLGFLLWRASRKFLADLRVELATRGYDDLSATHVNVMPMLDAEGTNAQALAGRLGISKQASGRIVGELERLGYVSRETDPADARGRLIRFTQRGHDLLNEGELAKLIIEQRWLSGLDQSGVSAMKQILKTIVSQDTA